jgi:hypothetical protein
MDEELPVGLSSPARTADFLLTRQWRLARNPARHVGLKRVAGHHLSFAMTAFGAFERATLEAFRPGGDVSRYHPLLTVRATRTMDRQKLWIGPFRRRHDAETIAPS